MFYLQKFHLTKLDLTNKLCLGLLLLSVASPSVAHTVKADGDVAATFHLEPSHNPKAGEPSDVWFALTKAGGEVIPLQDCDCHLAVKQADKTLARPPLQAINAEQYQGIPGSEMVFPAVGIYTLEISGKPKVGEGFKPFQLSYEVTVQPGQASAQPQAPQAQNIRAGNADGSTAPTSWLIAGAIGLLSIGLITIGFIAIKKPRS